MGLPLRQFLRSHTCTQLSLAKSGRWCRISINTQWSRLTNLKIVFSSPDVKTRCSKKQLLVQTTKCPPEADLM